MKSYVLQLYDAIVSEENESASESIKPAETISAKPKRTEPLTRTEIPVSNIQETPKPDPIPEPRHNPEPITRTYAPEKPKHAPPPVHEPPKREEQVAEQKPEQSQVPTSHKPYMPAHEPVKAHAETSKTQTPSEQGEVLQKLFDLDKPDEPGSRFSHVPIASIESAMGLNERIFTLNELFGGDKALFDAWCEKLNKLHSFSEAKEVLISGPAKDFKWSDPERVKMAQQFIRIVSRRYPKTVS